MPPIAIVQKTESAPAQARKDLACAGQTVHVAQTKHVNVQQAVHVIKTESAPAQARKDLACAGQTVYAAIL